MNPGDIYLGLLGQEKLLSATDRTITPQPVEIVKSDRAASGKLLEDVIRRYTNYEINYSMMTGAEYESVQSLYGLQQNLNLIIVNRDGSQTSQIVKMQPLSVGSQGKLVGDWVWYDVSFTLEAV